MTTHQKPLLSPRRKGFVRCVSIGECMVEMAPEAEAGQFRMGFAGDTFNTAWYLRQLRPDWSTRFVSRIGTDAVSDAMLEMMHDAQIDTAFIGRCHERSVGLSVVRVFGTNGGLN